MPEPPDETRPVRCPRCGYDQRGVVATWRECCPLEGSCSECGLQIAWRELLNPHLIRPGWCVEYAGGVFSFLRRAALTALLVHLPIAFWARLRMTHPIRRGRLLLYVVLCLLIAYVAFALCQGAFAWSEWSFLRTTWWGAGLTIGDGARAVFHAIVFPLSTEAPAIIPPARTRGSLFDAPAAYLYFWRDAGPAASFLAGALIAGPSTLIVLPESRRRAKVRLGHVARITVYGVTYFGFGLLALCVIVIQSAPPDDLPVLSFLSACAGMYLAVVILLLPIWWYMAVRRYLRMEHAPGVAVAMVAVAYLSGIVVSAYLHMAIRA